MQRLSIALTLALASAMAPAADDDAAAGKRKTVTCNGCHGQSSMRSVPSLGGQSASYFVAAMQAYQDDTRAHATMRDVAKSHSYRDIRNLAAYYAQFAERADTADAAASPATAAACESCHGPGGRNPVMAGVPVLAGQKSAFLRLALRDYRDGSRPAAAMQPQAAQLTDAAIDALADYFSGQRGLTVR